MSTVPLPLGTLSASGRFYAQIIQRNKASEVIIFPIDLSNEDQIQVLSDSSLIKRFTLESTVHNISWVNVANSVNGSKRARRDSLSASNKANLDSYLFVSLSNKKNYIFSPFKDEFINELNTDGNRFATNVIPSFAQDGTFWINFGNSAKLFNINDSNPIKSIDFPESLKVHQIEVWKHKSSEFLIVADNNSVKLLNMKTHKVIDLVNEEEGKVKTLSKLNDHLIISTTTKKLQIFDLVSKKIINTIDSSIKISKFLKFNNFDSTLGSISKIGELQILTNLFDDNLKRFNIKTRNIKRQLTDATIINDQSLLVSWNELEPKFKLFDLSTLQESTIIENQQLSQQQLSKQQQINKPSIQIPALLEEIEFVESYKLRDVELLELINSKSDDPLELLKVLNSNSHEDKIKTAVSKLNNNQTDLNNSLITKIFFTLTSKSELVVTYPALNTWLKWLLVFYSSLILQVSGSTEALKLLKSQISKNSTQLSTYLSLQGRLELLQSQLLLRQTLAKRDGELAIVNGDNSFKISDDLVSKAEEGITYVNGENDEEDVDDLIGSVGNSESELSGDDDDEEEENGDAVIEENGVDEDEKMED